MHFSAKTTMQITCQFNKKLAIWGLGVLLMEKSL